MENNKNVCFPESHPVTIIVYKPSVCQKKPAQLFWGKCDQKLRLREGNQ